MPRLIRKNTSFRVEQFLKRNQSTALTEMVTGKVLHGPEVNIQLPEVNLGEYLLDILKERNQPRAQVDAQTDEEVAASLLVQRCLSVAKELKARGVRKGDVVMTTFDNCLEYTYMLLGSLYIGAVFSPINPNLAAADLQHLLRLLSPRIVFCVPRVQQTVRTGVPAEVTVVELSEDRDAEWHSFLAHTDFKGLQSDPHHSNQDTAVILCSSGTTGAPKGVQLTHRNLHNVIALSGLDALKNMEKPPVYILVSPGFWVSGFFSTLVCLYINISQVLLRGFEVESLLRNVEKYKCNILALSPFQIVQIAKHPKVESYDLSSLFMITYAGAPLSLVMKEEAQKRLQKTLVQYYGLTECLFTVVPGPKNNDKPGTVGVVAPNTSVKLVDVETGKPVGPNKEGEICFQGPNVFKGYYKNPEATANMIDSEGWLHTGDIGHYDEDGYLFVHDRIKELIKQKGIQVIPADLESVLLAHPEVKDTAVVGIEHDTEQEQAVAFVVRQPGATVTEDQLCDLVKKQLPEYKWLNGGARFVDVIPRTASGKVLRRDLRQRARSLRDSREPRDPSPDSLQATGSVRKLCAEFEKLSNNQSLTDIKRATYRSVR